MLFVAERLRVDVVDVHHYIALIEEVTKNGSAKTGVPQLGENTCHILFSQVPSERIADISQLLLDCGTPSPRTVRIWAARIVVDVAVINDYLTIAEAQCPMADYWTPGEGSCRHLLPDLILERDKISRLLRECTSPTPQIIDIWAKCLRVPSTSLQNYVFMTRVASRREPNRDGEYQRNGSKRRRLEEEAQCDEGESESHVRDGSGNVYSTFQIDTGPHAQLL